MLKIRETTKLFNDFIAVNNVSFNVSLGEVVGLVGPNGSGKTTIMRMISTLTKPTYGFIEINGINGVTSPKDARKHLGVLLGGDVSLYDNLTARENIIYFAKLQGLDENYISLRINELCKAFNMYSFIDRKTAGFSRGMRQKVAFSCAVVHDPPILLLDEPSTGLDICVIRDVQKFILSCKAVGKSILITSHNMHEINNLCDRVIIINSGLIVADDTISSLMIQSQTTNLDDTIEYFVNQ